MNSLLSLAVFLSKRDRLTWIAPLLAICIIGGWFRLIYIGYDLPTGAAIGTDEAYYYIWAKSIRETGRPTLENGTGYPPAFLYLLSVEQIFTELARGKSLDPATDYMWVARFVNGLLGITNIGLAAWLGRVSSRSNVGGVITALLMAFSDQMIQESRRASANSAWLFFTLLAFVLLKQSQRHDRFYFVHLSLISSAVSFLFKYHSGVGFAIPFLYAMSYHRNNMRQLKKTLIVWGTCLSLLFAWLVFDYKVFEIVNTPSSATGSVIDNGRVVGLQSFFFNINLVVMATGNSLYLSLAGLALFLMILALFTQKFKGVVDAPLIFAFGIFAALFYVLMSFFRPTDLEKWLVLVALIYILTPCTIFGLLHIFATQLPHKNSKYFSSLVSLVILVVSIIPLGIEPFQKYYQKYQDSWSKPYTLNSLARWFSETMPQGGRVISEGTKLPYNYFHSPGKVHSGVVESIFSETTADYQARGYEYLIWTNVISNHPVGSFEELDARQKVLQEQGAREVLRLGGKDSTGPNVVVFALQPIQQNPLYLWFTPAISFRGYDINKESFKPGDDLELMFYWMSAERVKANYIVFIHVISTETGELLVGKDEPTDNGYHPTFTWGGDMQFIRDRHTLTIPATAKAGSYIVRFGMYDADTQARVQVSTPKNEPVGDVVVLQEIRIEK